MAAVSERILCVEDDEQIRRLISRLVEAAGHECDVAANADEARHLLETGRFAIVLCDIGLPGESGLDLLAELSGRSPDVATVMVTGQDSPATADAALELGAYGYVTKPFGTNSLRIDLANALHRRRLELERRDYEENLEMTVALRTEELRRAYRETVNRLGRAIDYHDGTTGAHIDRVSSYAATIARELGLGSERAELIRFASPLHDAGKIGVPSHLLGKVGPLTPEERREVERHTEAGYQLLTGSGNELLELAATVARTHHERWDGGGYPHGLAGAEIPLEGRIVAVADVYDALTSDRPYRRAMTVAEAKDYIVGESGAAFDPAVVDAFLASVDLDESL
jgi:response regulator RpfG family c-di-GMP phosphodiesterase